MDEEEYKEMQVDVKLMKECLIAGIKGVNKSHVPNGYSGLILTIDSCEMRMKIYRLEKEIKELKEQINNQ